MNIKRMLKKEARNVLPDESLKNSIKESVLSEEVTSVQTNVGTTMSIPKKKNLIITIVAIITILAVVASVISGVVISRLNGGISPFDELLYGDTYINIQINPGFEIMVDKNNRVSSVSATNKDGALVIYGTSYEGMPLDKAVNRLMKDSQALGFVLNDNKEINIIAYGEDNNNAKNVGTMVKTNIDGYLNNNAITKTTNMISPTREGIIELGINNKMDAASLQDMTAVNITREITNANMHEADKVTDYLVKNLNNDEVYIALRNQLKAVDDLEDALEDVLDYIEDIIGELEDEDQEEDDEEDDEEEDEEEDDKEILDINKLKDLISKYNLLCVGDFSEYKYEIKYQDNQIDNLVLREIQKELINLMGDDDLGTGIDGLEDKLEDQFNNYKKEYYGGISFDEEDDD